MKKVYAVVNIIILSVLFAIAAITVVTYSSGYVIDFKQKSISATSILEIRADPPDSEIFLDGEKVGIGSAVLKNLEPKVYKFHVKKDGYNDFEKYVALEQSHVESFEDIVLFKKKPDLAPAGNKISPEALEQISDSANITSANGEIFVNENFITRLSDTVNGACWYPGKNYIAFTSGGKLKIMYKDGSNIIDIADKTSALPVVFVDSGRSVLYDVSGAVNKATIR